MTEKQEPGSQQHFPEWADKNGKAVHAQSPAAHYLICTCGGAWPCLIETLNLEPKR